MSSVLVVRPSSLGDIVHALAIATDIARALPGCAVDWVVEESFAELPSICGDVRRTIPVALRRWRKSPLARATWREMRAFRHDIGSERYDHVLELQEQFKGALIARLARGMRHGFDKSSVREPLTTLLHDAHHLVPGEAHFLVKCRALAADALGYRLSTPPQWNLEPPRHVAAMPATPYIVALHGTSRDEKLWPDDRWRELLERAAAAGFTIVLPWGAARERERSLRIGRGIGSAVTPQQRLSISTLASLLARADLVVGVDTGFTHLAAALRTPTLALFTASDPAQCGVGVIGEHARDLGGNGIVASVDDVLAACGERLRTRRWR